MKKLSDAKVGRYTVRWVNAMPELKPWLREKMIKAGENIKVISQNKGYVLIRSESGLVAMEPEISNFISVG